MKRETTTSRKDMLEILLSIVFILFWMFAAGSKVWDSYMWQQEMYNQVFSRKIAFILLFAVPITEIVIAALFIYSATRFAGIVASLLLMLVFTTYVGLALIGFYKTTPCSCAGLLGQNSSWGANFALNLSVTIVMLTVLIFTVIYKFKERKKKSMNTTMVSHVQLTT